mmetsp:Transcript_48356/g.84224  ORF Transcript_48356/g.84224 Transcript_48356/m.84224 type:complete len:324 (+) Transcript_48356:1207-2178(+)
MVLIGNMQTARSCNVPHSNGCVPRAREQNVRHFAVPQEATDVIRVPLKPSNLPVVSHHVGPIPYANGLIITAGCQQAWTDRMERNVEDPGFVASQHKLRLRLRTLRNIVQGKNSNAAILGSRREYASLGRVPSHSDHGPRVLDPSGHCTCVRICDTCEAICATRGNLNAVAQVPLHAVSLALVHLLPEFLYRGVSIPDKQVSSAAHRADVLRCWSERKTVQELVLPGIHLAVTSPGGDAPQLDMPIIGRCCQQVKIIRMESHIEDGLRVSRGRRESHSAHLDVTYADSTVLEGQDKPVGMCRNGLYAIHTGIPHLDLLQRSPL